jgi:hypothetical protein
MLETCDPEGVRCGILGKFVPPGAKGQVIFLDKSVLSNPKNPVNPDSRPVACKYENEYLSKNGKR